MVLSLQQCIFYNFRTKFAYMPLNLTFGLKKKKVPVVYLIAWQPLFLKYLYLRVFVNLGTSNDDVS